MKITHDIHMHTFFSSCSCMDTEASMLNCIKRAAELGHKVLGVSNHMWDERVPGASNWYKGQNIDYVLEEKGAIPEDTFGVKVLFGAESEFFGMSNTLGITAESARKFDYILVPHTHTHMKNNVMPEDADTLEARRIMAERIMRIAPEVSPSLAKRMTSVIKRTDAGAFHTPKQDHFQFVADFMHDSFDALLSHPEFIALAKTTPTIIAHPFAPCGYTIDEKNEILARLNAERLFEQFSLAARMNVAMDINLCQYYRAETDYKDDPMVAVMRIALDAGCKFSFGTDAHGIDALNEIRRGDIVSDAIGITEDDLVDIVKV